MTLRHKKYELVKQWASSRNIAGYPIPVWLYGPPGLGKTEIVLQLAEEFAASIYFVVCSDITTDTRVLGFRNASTGEYVEGAAYAWYKNGGILFFNEIDNCAASGLVALNTIVSNTRFRFPNGEWCEKHKDCYAIADANTLGTGSQAGFRRQSQDAAVRNRWAKVRLEYDEALERSLAPVPEWVEYVQKVRRATERLAKSNIYITPRDSIIGSAALVNGMSDSDVSDHLFSEFSEDAKAQVLKEVGLFVSQKNRPKPKPVQQVVGTPEGIKIVDDPEPWKHPHDKGLDSVPTWNESNPYRKISKKIRQYE